MARYFTKSVFKEALECPMRMNYCNRTEYANQTLTDDFLESLAEGGFQVGELAKVYYGVKPEHDLNIRNPEECAKKTRELLRANENITLAEAGFIFGNCFCRVDILKKTGREIELIEVKAKSWGGEGEYFVAPAKKKNGTKNPAAGRVRTEILPYVYDVAFQKYVMSNSLNDFLPGCRVKVALMMADKRTTSDTDHLNQYFKIVKNGDITQVERKQGAERLMDGVHVLTAFFDVDEVCDKIIDGGTPEQKKVLHDRTFVPFIREMSEWYCGGRERFDNIQLSTACYKCPYWSDGKVGKQDGYDKCWRAATSGSDAPYVSYTARPLVEDLWGGGNTHTKRKIVESKKYFLDQVIFSDLVADKKSSGSSRTPVPKPGLEPPMRKWIQILMTLGREREIVAQQNLKDGVYVDIEVLKSEMRQWKFPLHMIDFETSAVALPFYKGMKPYENVAFQFSHHIIDSADGGKTYTIRHAGQWINATGDFPNFEFVRKLKESVGEKGTIFRYSNHENTILRHIRRQLLERDDQPDREELVRFIDSITHMTGDECDAAGIDKNERPCPDRDMVDLWDVVKRCYYDPAMKGSNSIKVVLPSVLNRSKLLKDKYSKPIYGSEIESRNFTKTDPKIWISEENGVVVNPYKKLDGVSSFFPAGSREIVRRSEDDDGEEESYDDSQINNGGAALWAYGLLQFCEQEPEKKEALIQALYRYCELDTLAMVFIWEFFNELVK